MKITLNSPYRALDARVEGDGTLHVDISTVPGMTTVSSELLRRLRDDTPSRPVSPPGSFILTPDVKEQRADAAGDCQELLNRAAGAVHHHTAPTFPPITAGDLRAPTTYTLRPTEQDRRALAVIARTLRPDAPSTVSMTAVVREAVLHTAGVLGGGHQDDDRSGLLRTLHSKSFDFIQENSK